MDAEEEGQGEEERKDEGGEGLDERALKAQVKPVYLVVVSALRARNRVSHRIIHILESSPSQ